jgi:NAD(P)-dependent dehydrogenase (short-subunit alcohol dehydrogenase family)
VAPGGTYAYGLAGDMAPKPAAHTVHELTMRQTGTNGGMATAVDFSKMDVEAFKVSGPVMQAHAPDPSKEVPIDVSDVADAIVFLASDASKKISGAVLPVDKAWSTI